MKLTLSDGKETNSYTYCCNATGVAVPLNKRFIKGDPKVPEKLTGTLRFQGEVFLLTDRDQRWDNVRAM